MDYHLRLRTTLRAWRSWGISIPSARPWMILKKRNYSDNENQPAHWERSQNSRRIS